jgi:hypothetical protein
MAAPSKRNLTVPVVHPRYTVRAGRLFFSGSFQVISQHGSVIPLFPNSIYSLYIPHLIPLIHKLSQIPFLLQLREPMMP